MIEYIVLFFIFLYFIIASIEDIKKREVYDYLNYSLVFFILIVGILDCFISNSFLPLKYVSFGILVGFLLGSILYYLGIWGGGDAKFLIGFSGSSFYLMKFVSFNSNFTILYDFFLNKISIFLTLFVNYFLNIILLLDLIFLLIIFINIFLKKRENMNVLNLFLILFFLFLGLYLDYSNLVLLFLGFTSFILIFFAEENIFKSVYFTIKKDILNLNESEIIDSSILKNDKLIVNFEEVKFGLRKEDIHKIEENFKTSEQIKVRKILPYSILIALNFLLYIFKIVNIEVLNLDILFFLLEFLFLSFIVGGIMTILILTYLLIKNYKKINFKISKFMQISLFVYTIFVLILGFIKSNFLILLFLVFVYFLFKLSKEIEKFAFVKAKPISQIVLGDWIVEDIKVNNKVLYDASEFKLGVDEHQLLRIQELAKKNKHLNSLLVKDGIAFLPPLFLGFILMLIL